MSSISCELPSVVKGLRLPLLLRLLLSRLLLMLLAEPSATSMLEHWGISRNGDCWSLLTEIFFLRASWSMVVLVFKFEFCTLFVPVSSSGTVLKAICDSFKVPGVVDMPMPPPITFVLTKFIFVLRIFSIFYPLVLVEWTYPYNVFVLFACAFRDKGGSLSAASTAFWYFTIFIFILPGRNGDFSFVVPLDGMDALLKESWKARFSLRDDLEFPSAGTEPFCF